LRLIWFSVKGYRRFVEKSTVRLDGRVIAIVGPNEAGKTSLLAAMELLNDDEPLEPSDRSRTGKGQPEIAAMFALDDDDREALSGFRGGQDVRTCKITKIADGKLRADLSPPLPHDTSHRQVVVKDLARLRDLSSFKKVVDGSRRIGPKAFDSLLDSLSGENELDEAGSQALKKLAEAARTAATSASNLVTNGNERNIWGSAATSLDKLITRERQQPTTRAERVLLQRRPRFLLFDPDSRDLPATYNLSGSGRIPQALKNLAAMCELPLQELRGAVKKEDIATHTLLITDANRLLEQVFSRSWVNEDVVPVLNLQAPTLHILVRTVGRAKLSTIAERSAGLLWFLALLAFIANEDSDKEPILLVDEAESHLSYDAQASLVAALNEQRLAQKIIYTTHSAGCLPSDLGTGIRTVLPKDGAEESTISNAFWKSGPGFTPILMAMGASALAFTPARYVAFGEGPSECILLPTLLRAATGRETLPFQIAPGLAEVTPGRFGELSLEGGAVIYIVDDDDGGATHKDHLVRAGVDPNVILSYSDTSGTGTTLEDLIDAGLFVDAVNAELSERQHASVQLTIADLPPIGRSKAIREWCKQHGLEPVTKVTLCQRIVDIHYERSIGGASRDPATEILTEDARAVLTRLLTRVEAAFGIPSAAEVGTDMPVTARRVSGGIR
jgi:hypothetical protein